MPELCRAFRPHLQKFADGELPKDRAAQVRSHLMDCLSCRAIAGEVYKIRRYFDVPDEVQAPSDFASRVAAAAFSAPVDRAEDAVLPFVRFLAAIAASVLILSSAFFFVGSSGNSEFGIEAEATTLKDVHKKVEKLKKQQRDEEAKKARR